MIIVPQKENYTLPILVSVSGEVVRQGVYPIVKNGSTVEDVILMAGGITPLGNPGKIVIIRRGKFIRKNQLSAQGTSVSSEINSVRPEINSAIVKAGTTNDFSIIPVESVKSKIVLEESDDIVVPKKENFVYISGNVEKPGAYEYVEGKDVKYYVEKAGGYTPKADKRNTFIIAQYKEIYQIKNYKSISDGDIIVIPDSQEAKRLTTIWLPLFQVIVTTISVFLAIYISSKK